MQSRRLNEVKICQRWFEAKTYTFLIEYFQRNAELSKCIIHPNEIHATFYCLLNCKLISKANFWGRSGKTVWSKWVKNQGKSLKQNW